MTVQQCWCYNNTHKMKNIQDKDVFKKMTPLISSIISKTGITTMTWGMEPKLPTGS